MIANGASKGTGLCVKAGFIADHADGADCADWEVLLVGRVWGGPREIYGYSRNRVGAQRDEKTP